MKAKLLYVLLLCQFSQQLIANNSLKTLSTEIPTFNFCFTKIGASNWASGGTGMSEYGNPVAPYSNPACLAPDRLTIYCEFGKGNKLNWFEDINFGDRYILPSYFSIAKPFGKWNISAGYMNYYYHHVDREISPTFFDPESPDGYRSGPVEKFETDERLHSIFVSTSYRLNDIMSAGIMTGFNIFNYKDDLIEENINNRDYGGVISAGLLVRPFPNLALAYNAKYITDFELTVKLPTDKLKTTANTSLLNKNNPRYIPIHTDNLTCSIYFPWSLETGMLYQPVQRLMFLAMMEVLKWDNESKDLNNIVNFRAGVKFGIFDPLSIRFGYFTQNGRSELTSDIYDQKFLTTGFDWNITGRVTLSASYLDGILLSEDNPKYSYPYIKPIKQRYFSLGLEMFL